MYKTLFFLTVLLLLNGCSPGKNDAAFTSGKNPAAQAMKKSSKWWNGMHREIIGKLSSDPELILIGNSIFQSVNDAEEIWKKHLDQYRTVNMGISGDRTENVIWRLQHGALENIDPRVAVILIGTNNVDGNHYLTISTPEELAGGIWRICEIVQEKLPGTRILLMGILPYGKRPNFRNNIIKATNRLISRFPERDPDIHYTDIGYLYQNDNGGVKKELMPDFLHPDAEGLMMMFDALEKDISRLMDDKDLADQTKY